MRSPGREPGVDAGEPGGRFKKSHLPITIRLFRTASSSDPSLDGLRGPLPPLAVDGALLHPGFDFAFPRPAGFPATHHPQPATVVGYGSRRLGLSARGATMEVSDLPALQPTTLRRLVGLRLVPRPNLSWASPTSRQDAGAPSRSSPWSASR